MIALICTQKLASLQYREVTGPNLRNWYCISMMLRARSNALTTFWRECLIHWVHSSCIGSTRCTKIVLVNTVSPMCRIRSSSISKFNSLIHSLLLCQAYSNNLRWRRERVYNMRVCKRWVRVPVAWKNISWIWCEYDIRRRLWWLLCFLNWVLSLTDSHMHFAWRYQIIMHIQVIFKFRTVS